MIYLYLDGGGETINLNEMLDDGYGTQVISGVTGFGLPSLDVQWQEGAGNGATYRGHRVTPRDVDLPIHIHTVNRADLKAAVNKLARVLDNPCTLRLVDDGITWVLKVIRVGGGEFTYGEDTEGEYEFSTIVTLRAGQPFWEKVAYTSQDIGNPGSGFGKPEFVTITNGGSAPMYPVYEVTGPGINFTAWEPSTGRSINFSGLIEVGETITIDTEKCTVVNQDGENRYDGLDRAPVFYPIIKDRTDLRIGMDNTSSDFIAEYQTTEYNHVINPTFDSNTTSWTLTDCVYDSTAKRVWVNGGVHGSEDSPAKLSYNVTGLTAGVKYKFLAKVSRKSLDGRTLFWKMTVTPTGGSTKEVIHYYDTDVVATGVFGIPFTLPAGVTAATITVESWAKGKIPNGGVWVEEVYVGNPSFNFNGDNIDTASVTFDWTGTPHASKSSRTSGVVPSNAGAKVVIKYKEREWVII